MEIAIIASSLDKAGMNIKINLIRLFPFQKTKASYENEEVYELNNIRLYTTSKESIFCDNIDEKIKAEQFIFITRHKSKAEVPSLSVHISGNWSKAEAGGKEKTLCTANASLLKEMFIELNKQGAGLGYEITVEQVHHGPAITKPVMFIEIGSSEKHWEDWKAGEAIAKTVMNTLQKPAIKYKTAILLGGGHYNQMANKILLRTDLAIGQICAKHELESLDESIVMQAVNKTLEKVDLVILDWKGLGQHKQKIVALLDKLKLKYETAQRLLK